MPHAGLHALSRLQHERQLHFSRAEQLADGFHAVEQDLVNDLNWRVFGAGFVEVFLYANFFTIDDALFQALLDRHGQFCIGSHRHHANGLGEVIDEFEERIVSAFAVFREFAPIVNHVERHLQFFWRNLVHWFDLGSVENGAGDTAFDRLVKVDGIEHLACMRFDAKRHVGQTKGEADVGELGFDLFDAIQGPQPEFAGVFIALGNGER